MLNPKPPFPMFVQLDGAWHQVGDDEHTTSGLVIPILTPWVRELPEGAKLAETADEKPKTKAKAKK